MSQDSIGVVTTGRGKLQEWKTTQKQNLSRKSRGTLTVKWAGSRDKIFSPSGRGSTFFLTSLFIELIDPRFHTSPPRKRGLLLARPVPLPARSRFLIASLVGPALHTRSEEHTSELQS